MEPQLVGLGSVVVMVVLIYLGMHVALSLALTSCLAVWLLRDDPVLAARLLALASEDAIANYVFGVIPLFVLMGLLVEAAGLGKDAFDVAQKLFQRVRAGLGMATVGANAIFAAITGVSIASAAVFTRVAVPPMLERGYSPRFAVGVVAGSSVLGMLIPPSLLLIVYGVLAEASIGDLFIAGIVPGLLLAAVYCVAIFAMSWLTPNFVGAAALRPAAPDGPAESAAALLVRILPVVTLIALVFGGIYGGVFTPTEAGAAGALGALVMALLRRRLDLAAFWRLLVETGHITAAICLLFIAATMYSRMLALSGFPSAVGGWLAHAELGFYAIIALYVLIIVAMGMILDSTSIMLIMVPLFVPVMTGMGVDLVWFGIITVIAVEIGLLTPPFGISVFVVKATVNDPRVTLGDIFAGAAPFAALMGVTLTLIVAFPWLATGLIGR